MKINPTIKIDHRQLQVIIGILLSILFHISLATVLLRINDTSPAVLTLYSKSTLNESDIKQKTSKNFLLRSSLIIIPTTKKLEFIACNEPCTHSNNIQRAIRHSSPSLVISKTPQYITMPTSSHKKTACSPQKHFPQIGSSASTSKICLETSDIINVPFNQKKGPSFKYMSKPNYPTQAKRYHIEGTVILKILIAEDGLAKKIQPIEVTNTLLEQSAITAIRHSTFYPFQQQGIPTPCWTKVSIRFCLN